MESPCSANPIAQQSPNLQTQISVPIDPISRPQAFFPTVNIVNYIQTPPAPISESPSMVSQTPTCIDRQNAAHWQHYLSQGGTFIKN